MDEPNNLTINGNISVNSTNIALGFQSGNIINGTQSGLPNGLNSTAVGSYSGMNHTGQNNTFIGSVAGQSGTTTYFSRTGSNNTYLGYLSSANASGYTNSTAIGTGAVITASNQIKLGTTSETVVIPGPTTAAGLITANGGLTIGGKIIFTTPPIYIRVANGTQSILDGETTLLFHNLDALSSANTGITYNAGTFTNSNSYKITVNIAATLILSGSLTSNGTRMIGIYAGGIKRATMAGLCPNATIPPALCASCNVSIAASGTFYVTGYQNSGGANIPVLSSTQISILVL